MTHAAADPISSGRPYQVLAIGGRAPSTLEQFLGNTSFTISKDGAQSQIRGIGTADASGVRFHEKSLDHDGKDVRTWHITEEAGEFAATSVSSF